MFLSLPMQPLEVAPVVSEHGPAKRVSARQDPECELRVRARAVVEGERDVARAEPTATNGEVEAQQPRDLSLDAHCRTRPRVAFRRRERREEADCDRGNRDRGPTHISFEHVRSHGTYDGVR